MPNHFYFDKHRAPVVVRTLHIIARMDSRLLGGLSPRDFLRRYWQKRPHFVRGALPGFAGVINERALAQLASRDDVESRLVERRGTRWETQHGPFARIRLNKTNATLLVNGVNHHVDAAERLLQRFAFVPQARIDDVMVSYATPGGGVGPHVDHYDVFLLQGPGRRAWRIENKRYVAAPGDLLYLPPGVPHDGVALESCFPYSIGFRAPRGVELGAAFLDWLHERGLPDARYRDPRLAPTASPGRIPAEMVAFTQQLLSRIRWSSKDVGHFLGQYLSQPKGHVVFSPAPGSGPLIRLDEKTQLLYSGERFFINGEPFSLPRRDRAAMRELADRRGIATKRLASQSKLIREWRRAGWLRLTRS